MTRYCRECAATLLGLTLLIGWRPNVQVIGTCGDVPSVVAESDSLGIVAVATDEPDHTVVCSWHTVGTGVEDEVQANGCSAEAR